jgi:hypothetical protein
MLPSLGTLVAALTLVLEGGACAAIIGKDDRTPLSQFARERGWPADLVTQIKANTVQERCFERVTGSGRKGGVDTIVGSAAVVGNVTTIVGSFHQMLDESTGTLRAPRMLDQSGKRVVTCAVRNFLMKEAEWVDVPEIDSPFHLLGGHWDPHGDQDTANANVGEDYSVLRPSRTLFGVVAPYPLADWATAKSATEFYYVSAYEGDLAAIREPYIRECKTVLFEAFAGVPQVIDTDCDQGFGASGGALLAVDTATRVLLAVGECVSSPNDPAPRFVKGVVDTFCVALADPGPIEASGRAAAALRDLADAPLLVNRSDAALKGLKLTVPKQ